MNICSVNRPHKRCPFVRLSFVFPSSFFGPNSALHSCVECRQNTLATILFYTGCRVSEGLRLRGNDIILPDKVHISASKNSRDRTIHIVQNVVFFLYEFFQYGCNFETIDYQNFYRFCQKMPAFAGHLKNGDNHSITHYFRKALIRRMYVDYRLNFDTIIDFFGWKEKRSLLYYL